MHEEEQEVKQPALLIKTDSITVITDDGPRIVRRGQENFSPLQEAIRNKDWTLVESLANPLQHLEEAVGEFGQGRITLQNNCVMCDGQPMNGYVVNKILSFANNGLPFEHLLRFLENLQENPSMRARDELYKFLETEDLPITTDGHFLAYKAVRSNWMDKYSGTIDNRIGNIITMPRAGVDDNQARGCSKGLHAGALSYVKNFGNEASSDIFLIVKINPADVVCIPSEDVRKLRCCRYEVTGTMAGEMVYHAYEADGRTPLGGKKVDPAYLDDDCDDEDPEDWEDYDDDYDYALDDEY